MAGWPSFWELALSLNPLKNFRCVRMRGRPSSVAEISVLPTGISVSGLENQFALRTWDVSGMNSSQQGMPWWICLLYFHSYKSFQSYDGRERNFLLTMFALFLEFRGKSRSRDLWPFLIMETGLTILIWTKGKIRRGNLASPVKQAMWRGHQRLFLKFIR